MARPRKLTAERAKKALRQHHERLLEKAASGTLTSWEAKKLSDFADEPPVVDEPPVATNGSRSKWAKNYAVLAREVGYSRRQLFTIRKAHKDDPRLPEAKPNGTHDVSAWAKFMDEVGSKSGLQQAEDSNDDVPTDDLPLPRKAKLEIKKMELQLEERIFRLQRDRGEWIRKDVAEEAYARNLTAHITDLYRSFCSDLPAILEGQTAAIISKTLKDELDRISEHSHNRGKEICKSKYGR